MWLWSKKDADTEQNLVPSYSCDIYSFFFNHARISINTYIFVDLILEPSKQYSSTVAKSFHLSMATLDVKTVEDGKKKFMLRNQMKD